MADKISEEIICVLQKAVDVMTSFEDVDEIEDVAEQINKCIEAVQYGEWRICQECGTERTTENLEAGKLACLICGKQTNCPF